MQHVSDTPDLVGGDAGGASASDAGEVAVRKWTPSRSRCLVHGLSALWRVGRRAGPGSGAPKEDPGAQGMMIAACRSDCGLIRQEMSAAFAIQVTVWSACFEYAEHRDGQQHCGRLVACADPVRQAVAAHSVGLVLDPRRRGFGCA